MPLMGQLSGPIGGLGGAGGRGLELRRESVSDDFWLGEGLIYPSVLVVLGRVSVLGTLIGIPSARVWEKR